MFSYMGIFYPLNKISTMAIKFVLMVCMYVWYKILSITKFIDDFVMGMEIIRGESRLVWTLIQRRRRR